MVSWGLNSPIMCSHILGACQHGQQNVLYWIYSFPPEPDNTCFTQRNKQQRICNNTAECAVNAIDSDLCYS